MNQYNQLTPQEMYKLNGCIREMVDSLFRVQAEKDLQKEIKERVKDEFPQLDVSFTDMVKESYDNSVSDVAAKKQAAVDLLEEIETTASNFADRLTEIGVLAKEIDA